MPVAAKTASMQDACFAACAPKLHAQKQPSPVALRLASITCAWMAVECGVSAYAAASAHSPAMLAFGADSLVELLSAFVVLLPWIPGISLSERSATRTAAVLLFALAAVVGTVAVVSLALHGQPARSFAGIGITAAALLAMPVLATAKRREARRCGDAVLNADAAQSATCAYLALITLAGLAANAAFGIAWLDSAAALLAIPLLVHEGSSAWQGHSCGCC